MIRPWVARSIVVSSDYCLTVLYGSFAITFILCYINVPSVIFMVEVERGFGLVRTKASVGLIFIVGQCNL